MRSEAPLVVIQAHLGRDMAPLDRVPQGRACLPNITNFISLIKVRLR